MDLGLGGKVALVTGGSRGIGYAIARELAREGAAVAICGRDEGTAKEAAAKLAGETNGRVVAFRADTASAEDIRLLVEGTVRELGGLAILVNNAARAGGTGAPDTFDQLNEPLLREDFDVKVLGYVRCAHAAAPYMEARGWGRIVNIVGMAAREAAGVSGGMRNAAVMNFTKVLSQSLGPKGITVNAVHPSLTKTDTLIARMERRAQDQGMSVAEVEADMAKGLAIRRLVTPDDIAPVVAFLCSEQAGCITGEAVAASGGSSQAVFY